MKYNNAYILLAFAFFFSCQKLEIIRINKLLSGVFSLQAGGVQLESEIIDFEEKPNLVYGHLWGTDTLNYEELISSEPIKKGKFTQVVSSLSVNQIYFYRAFIKNDEAQYSFGAWKSFSLSPENIQVTISTTNLSLQNQSSISVTGNISGLNGLSALEYGFCWSQNPEPTINDSKNMLGSSNEDVNFNSTITNLFSENQYYIRSYVRLGTDFVLYGNTLEFIIPELRVITNNHSITNNIAVLSGTIESLSVTEVIEHGFCWATNTSTPIINNNKLSLGSINQTGNFFNNFSLTQGLTYYYRAYAITENNIKYGIVRKIEF